MKVTVNNADVKEIDWSKPQLVIGGSGSIVLSIGISDCGSFQGIDLGTNNFFKVWDKAAFQKYKGSITLEND
jgi:hypothetical protein